MIDEVTIRFRQNMDNDLDIGKAFDDILKVIDKLLLIKLNTGLGIENVKKLKENLKGIDSVFGVIF